MLRTASSTGSGRGMAPAALFTAGSITQIRAPTLATMDEARLRTPANIDVISTMRKTAKVMPMSRAPNFARSLTSSL